MTVHLVGIIRGDQRVLLHRRRCGRGGRMCDQRRLRWALLVEAHTDRQLLEDASIHPGAPRITFLVSMVGSTNAAAGRGGSVVGLPRCWEAEAYWIAFDTCRLATTPSTAIV